MSRRASDETLVTWAREAYNYDTSSIFPSDQRGLFDEVADSFFSPAPSLCRRRKLKEETVIVTIDRFVEFVDEDTVEASLTNRLCERARSERGGRVPCARGSCLRSRAPRRHDDAGAMVVGLGWGLNGCRSRATTGGNSSGRFGARMARRVVELHYDSLSLYLHGPGPPGRAQGGRAAPVGGNR